MIYFDYLVALKGDKYISDIGLHVKVRHVEKSLERVAYSVQRNALCCFCYH